MLDLRRIREEKEQVAAALAKRMKNYDLDAVIALDDKRKALLGETEALKAKRNKVSKEIPMLKKNGEDVSAIMAEMKQTSDRIKELDEEVAQVEADIRLKLLDIPQEQLQK